MQLFSLMKTYFPLHLKSKLFCRVLLRIMMKKWLMSSLILNDAYRFLTISTFKDRKISQPEKNLKKKNLANFSFFSRIFPVQIFQIKVSFLLLVFCTNLCPIKIDLSGTTFWPLDFKNSPNWPVLAFIINFYPLHI